MHSQDAIQTSIHTRINRTYDISILFSSRLCLRRNFSVQKLYWITEKCRRKNLKCHLVFTLMIVQKLFLFYVSHAKKHKKFNIMMHFQWKLKLFFTVTHTFTGLLENRIRMWVKGCQVVWGGLFGEIVVLRLAEELREVLKLVV